jgi:hypothetical protein
VYGFSSLKPTMFNEQHLNCLQVELVLSQHSGIAKAVVFGVPDSRLGEKIVACVSIRDDWRWVDASAEHQGEGKEVSAQILEEHCRVKNLSRLALLITIFEVECQLFQIMRLDKVLNTGNKQEKATYVCSCTSIIYIYFLQRILNRFFSDMQIDLPSIDVVFLKDTWSE